MTSTDTTPRIAAMLTCHERRSTTLAALDALTAATPERVDLRIVVVDDGSTDGTAAAVEAAHPSATVLEGDGTLFWNGGMRLAHEAAMAMPDVSHLLWLNDDTDLDPDALERLLAVDEEAGSRAIVVGSCRDPVTGQTTYGGRHRPSRTRRMRFEVLEAAPVTRAVESMNGNVVLVPRTVAEQVGNLDPEFGHAFGDEDYALRAGRHGIRVLVAPGTVGTCARNEPRRLGRTTIRDDLRAMVSIKGLPPRDWFRFTRRWGGPLWPLYALSPYLRRTARILRAHLR